MPKPIGHAARDIVCPGCGYSVMAQVKEGVTDAPRTMEDVLDFFEVVGADEGCVLCAVCPCQFDPKTGKEVCDDSAM